MSCSDDTKPLEQQQEQEQQAAIKEEIWSWLIDEESCVTVARIGQTFRVSRRTASQWLADMPYFKSERRGSHHDMTFQVTEYQMTEQDNKDSGIKETGKSNNIYINKGNGFGMCQ
jgi:hypothetical protein